MFVSSHFFFNEPFSSHFSASCVWCFIRAFNHIIFLILASLVQLWPFSASQFLAVLHKTSAQSGATSSNSFAGFFVLLCTHDGSKIFSCYIILGTTTLSSWSHLFPACHPRNSRGISAVFFFSLGHRWTSCFATHVTYAASQRIFFYYSMQTLSVRFHMWQAKAVPLVWTLSLCNLIWLLKSVADPPTTS